MKVNVGSFDLSPVAAGDAAFAIDQQQFLQGYLPVVFLANYVRYGLLPAGNVHTGPNLITKDKAAQVIALSAKGNPVSTRAVAFPAFPPTHILARGSERR